MKILYKALVVAALGSPAASLCGQSAGRVALTVYVGSNRTGIAEFAVRRTGVGPELATVHRHLDGERGARTTAVIQFAPDTTLLAATIESRGIDSAGQVQIRVGNRRVSFRRQTARGESVREFPRPDRMIIGSESFPELFALLPTAPGPLTIVSPINGSRTVADLIDHGLVGRFVEGRQQLLHHFELRSAPGTIHLWFDEAGVLTVFEHPRSNRRAVRD